MAGDMYTGFRPWEMIQGGFGDLAQTGATAYQKYLADQEANSKVDPYLAQLYQSALGGITGPSQAPQVQPLQHLPQMQVPQMPGLTPPQQAVPDLSPRGLSAPGTVSPSGGPQGPMGGMIGGRPLAPSSDVPALTSTPAQAPKAAPSNPMQPFMNQVVGPGMRNAEAAPQPGRGQMAEVAMPPVTQQARPVSPGEQPLQATSTQAGAPPWQIRRKDIPMLEKLIPLAVAARAAQAGLEKTGIQETGRNQRATLSAGVKMDIAKLKAITGDDQLAARLQSDLDIAGEKLDVQQQEAYVRMVTELEKARMGLEGVMARVKGAKDRAAAQNEAMKYAFKAVELDSKIANNPAVMILPEGRKVVQDMRDKLDVFKAKYLGEPLPNQSIVPPLGSNPPAPPSADQAEGQSRLKDYFNLIGGNRGQ